MLKQSDKCAESNIYMLTYCAILRNDMMTPGVPKTLVMVNIIYSAHL